MGSRPLVLISGQDVLGRVGGHCRYVRAHARAVAELGFEPHVFCAGPRARVTRTDFGVVHHVAPRVPVALQVPLLAGAVVRFLSGRRGPHAIHGFAIWSAAGAMASRALRRRGVQAITVASAYGTRAYEVGAMQDGVHDHHGRSQRIHYGAWLRWIRSVDDPIERWGYASSRLVLVNYQSVAGILHGAYGPGLRVRRVPYAAVEAFADAGPPAAPGDCPQPIARLRARSGPLVVAISRHDPRKGIDVLLLALAQLAARGESFRACLIGPGRLLDAHRRLATRLGLDDRVVIVGQVPDTGPYLACADVFVLPSLAEASGSVSVVEALRSGTAVVATACDGIPEDLTDARDSLLVPPGDVAALSAALGILLRDEALRARIAAEGRATCERRFSAAGFVAALRGVYAELGIDGPARGASLSSA